LPFTGANLCKHRVADHRDRGRSLYTIPLLLRQPAGPVCTLPEILPARSHLLIFSAFYLTGCGLHCRQALLPRGRKAAPDIFLSLHQTSASL